MGKIVINHKVILVDNLCNPVYNKTRCHEKNQHCCKPIQTTLFCLCITEIM